MLDIIRNDNGAPCSLEELIEYLNDSVDFSCQHSIRSSADMLGRLYFDRSFLTNYVLHKLKDGLSEFEPMNRYTPPSLMLGHGKDFFIRANLWRATDLYSAHYTGKSHEKTDINVYGLAHDHNFDFLTLNYFGPGYKSKMFTYEYSKVVGAVGENVELHDNGYLQLSEGQMYLYRKNFDVHIQYPPTSDSITINIMSTFIPPRSPNQYVFDIANSQVLDIVGGLGRQRHVFDMAILLQDPECDAVMRRIASKSECAKTRAYLQKKLTRASTEET